MTEEKYILEDYTGEEVKETLDQVRDNQKDIESLDLYIANLDVALQEEEEVRNAKDAELGGRIKNLETGMPNQIRTGYSDDGVSIDLHHDDTSLWSDTIEPATPDTAGVMSAEDKKLLNSSVTDIVVTAEEDYTQLDLKHGNQILKEVDLFSATAETSGLMSANDKRRLDAALCTVDDTEYFPDYVETQIRGYEGDGHSVTINSATAEKAGVMSAADKATLDALALYREKSVVTVAGMDFTHDDVLEILKGRRPTRYAVTYEVVTNSYVCGILDVYTSRDGRILTEIYTGGCNLVSDSTGGTYDSGRTFQFIRQYRISGSGTPAAGTWSVWRKYISGEVQEELSGMGLDHDVVEDGAEGYIEMKLTGKDGGVVGGSTEIPFASAEKSGFMSKEDKAKLDGVETGANNTKVVQEYGDSATSVMSQAAVTQADIELQKRMQGVSNNSNPYTDPFKVVRFSGSDYLEQFNTWLDGLHTDTAVTDAQKAGFFRVSLWGMLCEVKNFVINWGTMTFHQIIEGTVSIDSQGRVGWSDEYTTLQRRYEGGAWTEWQESDSGGSGSGFYNVTKEHPLESGYYTKETAIAALADADIKDEDKPGMILTFETSDGIWADYRFAGNNTGSFLVPESWEEYGGGKVKSISLNGVEVAPDSTGNVALVIDQMQVDESLDGESTNPVQNKVVTQRINEIGDAAVGGVEVIPDGDKNTLNILNKQGGIIASAEFTGGGGGGSTASRIILTAALDKSQVKEGGKAELTYSYNHVNSEGDATGIKADITITVSRGTTTTYQQTLNGVSAGTYTLDISEYLLVGTTDVYVKAVVTTEDGGKQTKQAYTSINVITLMLTSSYNLASAIAGGGYKNSDMIEIPFTITGSGTKDVSMYIDGAATPVSQTINKSGTVNGSFTIAGSSLASGRHTVQLVAERNGLKSDSIYIDILKAGRNEPFVGVKYTDTSGKILSTTHLTPTLQVAQYQQMSFNFIAYNPAATPAKVEVYLNGKLTSTINAPRSMQTYTNRFTSQGTNTLVMKVGSKSYTLNIDVAESSIDLSEATFGMIAKFDAAGRSNSESNPAEWESNGIKTTFEGFDWNSNGWTGESLKLTNGAKATINYKPFATDIKSTGLTIEMTVKVSNIMSRGANIISCINNGKGLLITAENASFKTGQTVDYTNEDGELVTREIKLGTNYVSEKWIKIALAITTREANRLMHIYVDGNRTGADVYDTSFNFSQDVPQNIVIDSSEADIEVRSIRLYNRAISDDEELENRIVDAETSDSMMTLYDDNNILGDTGGVDIDKIRAKGKGVLRIVRPNKLDDVYAENNKKTDFKADIYFYSPFGKEYDFVLTNCNIRIQGTSSTKYPSKNIRIYFNKGGENLTLTINGEVNPLGKNKYRMRPGAIPMNLFTMKSDYSDSSMSMNTGGAKLFNDILKELNLLTPPQRYEYEHGGSQLTSVKARTAIDGFPIDIFCAETVDGESEYYGQYNFNNEKSKSEDLFGMTGVEGFEPAMPMTFESLNNGEKMCLFQSDSDDEIPTIFDAALETNYPDDVKWAGLTEAQQNAVKRLYGWIRSCVPTGANSNNIKSFVSQKFKNEIDQYFDKDFILTYYLWTDYYLAVDQRAKNMMLRTWDGLKWYITYYDGDTQMGKRNDCFLVYTYTTDRDTYDAEASKYAFEGRDSWLWNLVLANLGDDLKRCAANLRTVMTNERVLNMFNVEQAGNWSDRAFNKSGEIKYIRPAIQEMYGKVWPFIYALQGSNTAHREYFIKNRFALLDAKYGTSNFTSDNVDMYISRDASQTADVIKITANEVYAFGYGTNNSPNIENTGIVQEGDIATLNISRGFTVNDPLRLYGASRMKVLDMTGAADHLKNGFDLGKCNVLRELNLQSKTNGSTGWWLVLNACKSLRKINVRNQQQAKTGSGTSKELDLSNQTKLEFLDARGTLVENVNFAYGAPLTQAYLPHTLTALKLEYLALLMPTGLNVESYSNVSTFIFSGCPHLDWLDLLGKCVNVKHIRVTGINMEGDGSLLEHYINTGGVDDEGNYTDTCALVGTYRLTRFLDEEKFAAYQAHYPELNIIQSEYTMLEFDDTVSDDANVSNLDNKSGYKYDTAYAPSGHISVILRQRHRVLAKVTKKPTSYTANMANTDVTINNLDGEMTYYPLDDTDSTKYADGSAAKLDSTEGDWMMFEPFFWSKGINDYLNGKHYSCYNSNGRDNMPMKPDATVLTLNDIKSVTGGYTSGRKIMTGKATLAVSYSTDANYSVCKVGVAGYSRVRFPSVPGTGMVGAVFADSDGNILKSVIVDSLNSRFEAGMYLISDIPAGASELHFSVLNTAEFDMVVLSNSSKIEDMEPDWVANDEHLCAVVGSSTVGSKLRACITGGSTTSEISWTDFHYYSVQRGMQQIDPLMHSRIANLFYAKYGRRDCQEQCGAGQHNYNRTTGGTASRGMTDTIGYEEAHHVKEDITNNLIDGLVHQYAWYKSKDEYGRDTVVQVNNICCLGYEDIYGNKYDMMDRVDIPNTSGKQYKWRIWMPDGGIRWVPGKTTGDQWITAVAHGKHMDMVPVGKVNGSSSTYYCDKYLISSSTGRVVYRGYYGAYANGGVSYAHASYDATSSYASVGSRLAFRGKIVMAESVAAYKAAVEVS